MLIWARKLTVWSERKGKAARELGQEEAEAFLTHLATSPRVAAWQVEQAADSQEYFLMAYSVKDWDDRFESRNRLRCPEIRG